MLCVILREKLETRVFLTCKQSKLRSRIALYIANHQREPLHLLMIAIRQSFRERPKLTEGEIIFEDFQPM